MDREVFSESEKRFLITQILQASSMSLERIFMLFNECSEEPRWEDIYLPIGRTLQECKAAFEAIRTTTSPFATPNSPGFNQAFFHKRKAGIGSLESSSSLSLDSKRRLSVIRGQDIGGQLILPKPSPTESMTSNPEGMFSQQLILPKPTLMESGTSISEVRSGHQHILPKPISPFDSGTSIPEVMVKKRGRPPKAEVERRQHAIARGEVNNPNTMVTQIRYIAPAEKSSIASSSTTSSQISSTSPKSGPVLKKSGPLRQPGEGRFSLNDYIRPSDRLSPSKPKKKALAVSTLAGPESSTTKVPVKTNSMVSSSPKTPISNIQSIEATNLETPPRKFDKKPFEGSPERF
ncbi:putative at hook domain-containing protein [Erysiphe necator]|uniref:Putative at hook domain-containing protein n=1 Tax=Uncinula necator TaxID=52586 RepID=A0A0B1PI42_UNCNE|nr:putative at hook domain-containing protein [Erysiphe necator]